MHSYKLVVCEMAPTSVTCRLQFVAFPTNNLNQVDPFSEFCVSACQPEPPHSLLHNQSRFTIKIASSSLRTRTTKVCAKAQGKARCRADVSGSAECTCHENSQPGTMGFSIPTKTIIEADHWTVHIWFELSKTKSSLPKQDFTNTILPFLWYYACGMSAWQ